MALALRNAPTEAQRSRPVAVTGRLLNCQLGGDDQGNTTATLRLQHLRHVGVVGHHAFLLCDMAWGGAA